jgi:hypothetical protein
MTENLPREMATDIFSTHDLGRMLAERQRVAPGIYEVIVQYKFGPCLLDEGKDKHTAMGIGFGGLGLRKSPKENPMTIVVSDKPTKRTPVARKVPKQS